MSEVVPACCRFESLLDEPMSIGVLNQDSAMDGWRNVPGVQVEHTEQIGVALVID